MDEALGRNVEIGTDGRHPLHQYVLDDERPSATMLDDVLDLGADEPEVDRDGHQPGSRQPDVDLQPLYAVVRQHGDSVTGLQAEPEQRIGEATGALVPLAIAQR